MLKLSEGLSIGVSHVAVRAILCKVASKAFGRLGIAFALILEFGEACEISPVIGLHAGDADVGLFHALMLFALLANHRDALEVMAVRQTRHLLGLEGDNRKEVFVPVYGLKEARN